MANTPRTIALLAGAAALAAGSFGWAADEPPKPELISGASARMLAETCAGCHGTDGASQGPASPTLAGMNGEYFTELMKGFRDGSVYSTIMGRLAKGYTDEEIGLMASFFAKQPFVPAKQEFDAKLVDKGAKLHEKFCEKCHSEGGKIIEGEEYYILAGQWTPYLHFAMSDFLEDRREMPKKMRSKVDDLMKKDGKEGLEALFAFYASQQ
ncbi:MAG: c-type cytochrome [Bdellovibrio bacteriovorus]